MLPRSEEKRGEDVQQREAALRQTAAKAAADSSEERMWTQLRGSAGWIVLKHVEG